MFKIKKYVYRVLTIALALLVMLNTTAIGVLAESSDGAVTPGPEDYAFSNGTITGLKAEYLKNLKDEEKQNIRLMIPDEINGVEVTAIGDSAFRQNLDRYKGVRFTYLDLSNIKGLTTIHNYAFYTNSSMSGTLNFSNKLANIGQQAFEGCSSLTGDLQIPDSVTTMGIHAFNGCIKLAGKLKLSEGMSTIPDYAFYNCQFTGQLIIPESVTSIGVSAFRLADTAIGFVGDITIPKNVTTIKKQAFLNQKGFTGVIFSECKIDIIKESTFKNTGLSGTLCIPKEIKTIESGVFYGTNLQTVYLPSEVTFIGSSSFDKCDNLSAIVCDKSNYDTIYNQLSSSAKNKLGYPITVSFDDGNGGVYENKECLYNLPYNFVKDESGVWSADSNYKLPELTGAVNKNKVWALSIDAAVGVTETSEVKSPVLYAISVYEKPKITVNRVGVDKIYDGKGETLKVTATHPFAKKKSDATPGDVVFYYTWTWDTIGTSKPDLQGYDENIYIVTDVRMPDGEISCTMRVEARIMGENDSYKEFYAARYSFKINLRQAEPTVTPVVAHNTFYAGKDVKLPVISLSKGDTAGTIKWKEGQTAEEGNKEYTWVFTPEENAVGSSNYKTKEGKISLIGEDKETSIDDVKKKVDDLPVIDGNGIVKESDKNSILDTFMHFDSLPQEIKESIENVSQDKIFDSIEKLPSVSTKVDVESGLTVGNKKDLIKNITTEDTLGLKENTVTEYALELVAKKQALQTEEQTAIDSLSKDITLADSFDVSVQKKIKTEGKPEIVKKISKVNEPITLVFDVPSQLRNAGSSLKLYLVRVHTDESGTHADTLPDEDQNPSTITVTSDKFSKYVIAYEGEITNGGSSAGGSSLYTITASAGEHGTISPEGKTYAYYGSSKTFNFTPDEGYEVADVLVDGGSVGAVSSYTFENITRAHTIAVTFHPIADDQNRIIEGVKATRIKVSSTVKKGAITVKWKQSLGFKVDYYQVFRSTKKNSGYGTKPFYTTKTNKQKSYKNTKSLRKGTRYYYKVRGVRTIDGKKVFTQWSNKTWRIAK